MLRLRKKRKGQSTAEYAILIGIVISAVVGMQTWVASNIRGKIRDAATGIDDTHIPGYPNFMTGNLFVDSDSGETTTARVGGTTVTVDQFGGELVRTFDLTVNRTGNDIRPEINIDGYGGGY